MFLLMFPLQIRSIKPDKRNCLFPEENRMIKLHRNYTQANCLLECFLFYAQRQLQIKYNSSKLCTPWYFPFVEESRGNWFIASRVWIFMSVYFKQVCDWERTRLNDYSGTRVPFSFLIMEARALFDVFFGSIEDYLCEKHFFFFRLTR